MERNVSNSVCPSPGSLAEVAADRVPKALAKVLRHERIDDRIDAAVEVGHEIERLSQVLSPSCAQILDHVEGFQQILHCHWNPADGKENDYHDQHLNDLKDG